MAIPGLQQPAITDFKGKKTTINLTNAEPGTLLAANNLIVLSDTQLRKSPGYTLVKKVGSGPIKGQPYDFQRNVDQKQFVFIQSGNQIYYMNADGSGLTLISSGETGTHQFVCSSFAAYSSDGTNAWRYVDNSGVLTKYKWGITAPTIAPGESLSPGTLTLKFGRTYVVCNVSKYTDSLGIQRVSVSAPSPVTAHTGPIANQVVTLSPIQVSADGQVNYKWIFATSDSPLDTSATYYFAAEISNATTSWGDTLTDDQLDQTRLAPFDNHPAPPAPILETFQNRIVAANGSLIQLSGYSEITLGIPEESWPTSLFFNVPSGRRTISGLKSLQNGTVLVVSTQDYWYAYTGYDASTFTEQDRIASPGVAGPKAMTLTPEGLMYLAANQSLRVWNGVSANPTSISDDLSKKLVGTLSMEDIDPAHIADSIAVWYDFGPMNLLVLFVRTDSANPAKPGYNLMQLWSFTTEARDTSGQYGAGSGVYSQLTGTYQTDKIPTDYITAAGSVCVGFAGQDFIYMGDANGNVYRWPDGFQDNGASFTPSAQLHWHAPTDGKSRFYWIDAITDRTDAAQTFGVSAITQDAPDQTVAASPTALTVRNIPSPVNGSQSTIRASCNASGVATGRYISIFLTFPNDNADAAVRKLLVACRPLNQGIA